jgi:hypothetical protein
VGEAVCGRSIEERNTGEGKFVLIGRPSVTPPVWAQGFVRNFRFKNFNPDLP